jgi:hypothetical protein
MDRIAINISPRWGEAPRAAGAKCLWKPKSKIEFLAP